MLLADRQILEAIDKGLIYIYPFSEDLLQPASVDIQLGDEIRLYRTFSDGRDVREIPVDPYEPRDGGFETQIIRLNHPDALFIFDPGDFILACTKQTVGIGSGIAARIEGKSTLGRLGIIVHATAGFIDPGFSGQLTLEMTNLNHRPIILRPGMLIAQLSFMELTSHVTRVYGNKRIGSHYQNQKGATLPEPLRVVS